MPLKNPGSGAKKPQATSTLIPPTTLRPEYVLLKLAGTLMKFLLRRPPVYQQAQQRACLSMTAATVCLVAHARIMILVVIKFRNEILDHRRGSAVTNLGPVNASVLARRGE